MNQQKAIQVWAILTLFAGAGAIGCGEMRQANTVLVLPPQIHALTSASAGVPGPPAASSGRGRSVPLSNKRSRSVCVDFVGVPGGQAGKNWCWAAAAQSILAYDGVTVSQEGLAAYFTGEGKDVQANQTTIMRSLHPELEGRLGGRVLVTVSPARLTSDDLVESIAAGHPVVVGIGGRHVLVAYAVTYATAPPPKQGFDWTSLVSTSLNGKPIENKPPKYLIESVEVWDPDQDSQEPIKAIEAKDLGYIDYLMTREAARRILMEAIENVERGAAAGPAGASSGSGRTYHFGKQFGGGGR